ncbi:hypothetical protein F5B22DRAFT_631113 [Xylaria bambusicola]|uniref:uncharacterized protein n=1 Tax=Xylaria bambusicola TaxID=326684 RepID=UPI0020078D0E|nr:uncharacterized protein F5B22DRAFT_631113 [Xylaria bambusicola]KAI0502978.1 hypothetical protein F5B22DRAFT_631113 [Xylaria bambusicola]
MFSKSAGQIIARMRNRKLSASLIPRSGLQVRARFSSTQAPNEPRPTGSLDHKNFYKTFGRPIAKVFLMAIFTYQLAYYFWVRLEQNEIRSEMQAIITDLETRIEALEQAKTQKKR